ncbi:MAG: TIM barrel protein [Planctomycetota bacterium]|jgi:ribulose-phosphate 3-epimerase|nr:TIM barrel protein [Planctomycetota bacterium]
MKLALGVKSDPIQYRYSYEWLFDLMAEAGAGYLQFGSFFEMYSLEPEWFARLREQAAARGIKIKSLFTAHRELGGLMSGDPSFERVARDSYRKLLDVATALGVEFAGSSMGGVLYDCADHKPEGMRRSVEFLKEMAHVAHEKGLRALTIEPMSCLAEPPTIGSECVSLMTELADYRAKHADAAPVHFCADISHGYADENRKVVEDNWSLFAAQIPWMCEFHFKNTDAVFNSTFGFSPAEIERGIVDLPRLRSLLDANADRFPVGDVTGYLELNHVKIGRDYTDKTLGAVLLESIAAMREHFDFAP